MDNFKQFMWIIENLTIEAFVRRISHWKDLFKEIGIAEIPVNDEFNLGTLVENKFENFRE